MKSCKASGCTRRASGYGHYCNSHRSRLKRHGDVRQKTITTSYMKPHVRALDAWLKGQVGAEKAWAVIEEHFAAMVTEAEASIQRAKSGPSHRPTVEACRDVVAVSQSGEHRSAILLVLAMIIHWHGEGSGVFASHQGFLTQLARRWRGLTNLHATTYHYMDGARDKRVYRDASRQQTKALGLLLCEGLGRCAFSIIGAQVLETEKAGRLRMAGSAMFNDVTCAV